MAPAKPRPSDPTGTPLRSVREHAVPPSPARVLDTVDLQLLLLLSGDARLSQRSLARELGMSAPAIAERIARLERQGVIRGYGVRLDYGALGFQTTVYLTITAMQGYEQGVVMDELAALPEVDEVRLMTGAFDMLVRLRVRDDSHLRQLLMNKIWQIQGIQRTETSITIAEMKPKNTAAELLREMLTHPRDAMTGSN